MEDKVYVRVLELFLLLFLLWEAGDRSTPTLRQGSYGAGVGGGGRERHLGACPLPGTPRVYMMILEVPSYLARETLWGWAKQLWAGALSLAGPAEMQVCFSEVVAFCWTEVSSWPETVSVLLAHIPAWFLACDIF